MKKLTSGNKILFSCSGTVDFEPAVLEEWTFSVARDAELRSVAILFVLGLWILPGQDGFGFLVHIWLLGSYVVHQAFHMLLFEFGRGAMDAVSHVAPEIR